MVADPTAAAVGRAGFHVQASEAESHHDDPKAVVVETKKTRLNKHAVADIGVMSGAILSIENNLKISSKQVEILVGSLNVCSLIGSLLSGKTSNLFGRPFHHHLGCSHISNRCSFNGTCTFIRVYVAEISPAMTRGFLTSLPEVSITVGILLGYVSNLALAGLPDHINWRLMLSLAAIPLISIGLCVLAMPASPHWLVMKGRLKEAENCYDFLLLLFAGNKRQELGRNSNYI